MLALLDLYGCCICVCLCVMSLLLIAIPGLICQSPNLGLGNLCSRDFVIEIGLMWVVIKYRYFMHLV